MKFVHTTQPQRVYFGTGDAAEHLATEITERGAQRLLVIASCSQQDTAAQLTNDLPVAATFTDVVMHVPVETAAAARQLATQTRADVIVSIGGGSTIGTAKALALTHHLFRIGGHLGLGHDRK